MQQEPDAMPGRTLAIVGLATVATIVALSALAAGLQTAFRDQLGGPRPIPPIVRAEGTPPSDLFDEAAPERTGLPPTWTMVDPERGVVGVPIEQAIELAHPELR